MSVMGQDQNWLCAVWRDTMTPHQSGCLRHSLRSCTYCPHFQAAQAAAPTRGAGHGCVAPAVDVLSGVAHAVDGVVVAKVGCRGGEVEDRRPHARA